MKKRYNKFVAYLLMDFSTVGIGGILAGLVLLIMGKTEGAFVLLVGAISLIPALLLTLYINSRTPKGERVGTWFRAYWLGWKIAWKIALSCTLVLIPAMLKWSIDISTSDLNSGWNNGQKYVYDENGNRYEVLDSKHVIDEKGNWHEVWIYEEGYPFIDLNGERSYLRV